MSRKETLDLDDQILELTYQRVRLSSTNDYPKWQKIQQQIEELQNKKNGVTIPLETGFTF